MGTFRRRYVVRCSSTSHQPAERCAEEPDLNKAVPCWQAGSSGALLLITLS